MKSAPCVVATILHRGKNGLDPNQMKVRARPCLGAKVFWFFFSKKNKDFFFEKKKQKTFIPYS
jgi:hypothetical protein